MSGRSRAAVRQVLGSLPLFSQLAAPPLDAVARASRWRRLDRSEVLFVAGQDCDAFFCVVRGQVKLTLSGADGGEKVLEIISGGETFGEAVMFAGRPYPVTATALLPSELLVVPAATVLDLVGADPLFARQMLAGMSIRLHTMISDLESISLRSATQRVAGLLLGLSADVDPAAGTSVIALPAAKSVLASRLNLTPETFSRTLRDLSRAGVISVAGRRITVLDAERLAAAC
ncbi:MAG: Crp/Fnr family transcriptional regulator [Kineosporiaceae bacterium]